MLRLAVLGSGKIVRTRLLPAARRAAGVCVTALGTRRPDGLDPETLVLAPDCRVATYAEVLDGRLADAVYIGLPNDLHAPWVERASAAGLHVLCEKPLAASGAVAERCRERCRAAGVMLAEAFMYRHDPRHEAVRGLMREAWFGAPPLIEATFSYPLFDLGNIRLSAERQGGALMDVGCYGIDLARLLSGEEPVDVACRQVRGERSKVDELTAVVLVFPSGVIATVTVSTRLARANEYRVRGPGGAVRVVQAFVPAVDASTSIVIERPDREAEERTFPGVDTFELELERFAAACAAGDPAELAPFEDGVANARVLEAARRSAGDGLVRDLGAPDVSPVRRGGLAGCALFFDPAGTLAPRETALDERGERVLTAAVAASVQGALVTGQPVEDPQVQQVLGLFSGEGAGRLVAYTTRGGCRLFRRDGGFEPDPVYGAATRLEREEVAAAEEAARACLDRLGLEPLIPSVFLDGCALRINVAPARRPPLVGALAAELPQLQVVALEGRTSVFVMRPGVGKGMALRWELERLPATVRPLYFGDEVAAGNDREALEIPGVEVFSLGTDPGDPRCRHLGAGPEALWRFLEERLGGE